MYFTCVYLHYVCTRVCMCVCLNLQAVCVGGLALLCSTYVLTLQLLAPCGPDCGLLGNMVSWNTRSLGATGAEGGEKEQGGGGGEEKNERATG